MPPPPPTSPPTVAALRARLAEVTTRDRRRLEHRLDGLGRRGRGDGGAGAVPADVVADVEAAEARVARRRAAAPAIEIPASLPIAARADDIAAAIRDHQVVVVAGETGSGKSTQLAKICLSLGRGVLGTIGHTQPRRLAARTVAERVAEELGVEVGGAVGYAVRFTDRVGDTTLVKVMTDGILLAEIQRDPSLSAYDTVIVDEAHERSLNIDFLLGYLRQLQPRRPDLKIVITSATIDTERFSRHFDDAPVIDVSGRTHPVEVRYRPYGTEPGDDRDQVQAVCDAVEELWRDTDGDVLVFLSGEREIHETADAVRALDLRGAEVLPLYARLAAAEQHRIFRAHRGRRVVLATNVAETSLTVPGVRSVVDAGTARVSRYSRRLKVQRLPIEAVSQASADQRAGRCGRVAAGTCIRLYAEDDLAARPAFTEPEVLRTNLASVVLQMAALGLGDVAAFPFVEPPDSRSIADGVALLEELGALEPGDRHGPVRLTPLGRRLARLPVDPRLGRMVLEADRQGCVREVLVLAAALSIQDPRERPSADRQAADEAHRRFADDVASDPLALLRLWDHLRERQRELSSNQFRKLCRAEFLNHLRVREWEDLYSQLRRVAGDLGIRIGTEQATPDAVHRALLSGLLSQIGMRDGQTREFRGARGARFAIAPGSVLARRPPRWVVVGELVETNRLWGRVAAPIQPEWAERLGAHLCKRTYGEPRWDARRATAVATERVSLHGLPIVSGRTVPYRRVDPVAARELFLRHALVEGDWTTHHGVLDENRKLVEELRALEARARRRDLGVDDDALFAFYAQRVPDGVSSGADFDRWWRTERATRPDLLRLTREALVGDGPAADAGAYPDAWRADDDVLALRYEWEPGAPADGVTLEVPLTALNRLEANGFDWQVPGLRPELVAALLRTLPKSLRRDLVGAADHVRAFLAACGPDDGPLLEVLADHLRRTTGTPVHPGDFDVARVPAHLRLTFAVTDDDGAVVAVGHELAELRSRLAPALRTAIARATAGTAPAPDVVSVREWAFGTLPRVVEVDAGGHVVEGFPALVDGGDHVSVRTLPTPAEQAAAMRAGTRRLLLLGTPSPRRALDPALTNQVVLALAAIGYGTAADLAADCTTAAVDAIVEAHGGPAWDEDAFAVLRAAVRAELPATAATAAREAGRIVRVAGELETRMAAGTTPVTAPSVADARRHLHRLVHPGFVADVGVGRLPDVARYLSAVGHRLDALAGGVARDRERTAALTALSDEVASRRAAAVGEEPDPAWDDVGWLLEELRVSLFAQVVGTAVPVSEQRVRKAVARLDGGR